MSEQEPGPEVADTPWRTWDYDPTVVLWRTGGRNKRTVYAQPDPADPVRGHYDGRDELGQMDTPELARLVVGSVNAARGLAPQEGGAPDT